jgi:hypothetical protein
MPPLHEESYIVELEQLLMQVREGITPKDAAKKITEESNEVLLSYFDEYLRVFFSGTALQDMVCYMCNMCSIEITDPIPSTLNMFMSLNVTFTVTKTGLLPFREMSMAIYPYTQMSEEQGNFLDEYVCAIERLRAGTVSTQMGGGMVVSLNKRASRIHYIPPSDVLTVFCEKVINTENHSSPSTRYAMCDIVLQTLGTTVGISRATLAEIYNNLRAHYEKAKARAVSTAQNRDETLPASVH